MLRWFSAPAELLLPALTARRSARALAALSLLSALPALAQVTVNQILFPVNVGRTLTATVTIDYTRTNSAAVSIDTPIPAQLAVNAGAMPAGCLVAASTVSCVVPAGNAGDSGSLVFPVQGAALGAFSLVATASAGGSSASNTGSVRSSGELTVTKSKLPAGNLLPGQSTTFTLQPNLAAGADDLPAGATLTLTDQLPGTVTDFAVTAISASAGLACNGVAAANTSRTVSCTATGPLTAAAVNALQVVITGAPGTTGSFTNVASVAAGTPGYYDRNADNNTANVSYTVDAGGDVQAQGSFPAAPVAIGSAQTLNLGWRNNGPIAMGPGGTVSTVLPAGFTVTSLPGACSGPALNTVLAGPTTVTCNVSNGGVGISSSYAIELLMPTGAPAAGSFTVTVAPPAGQGDAVPANNTLVLPWSTVAPFADLRAAKSKSPASGPVAPGSTVTTTLTVVNDAASTSIASWSAAGGGTELRLIDYLRPEEADGSLVTHTPGWSCSLSAATDPTDLTRTRRVECIANAAGFLPVGGSLSVQFSLRVSAVGAPVVLANRLCVGETALAERGLSPAQGPQPPGSGQTANDCTVAGTNLVATNVTSGQAAVAVRKESSVDNGSWFDSPDTPPTLTSAGSTQFWRITVTTPAAAPQAPIPTLVLSDVLPGILNVSSPGAPAPSYQTPAIAVSTQVTSGAATGNCPNLAAGGSNLQCTFTNVQPGTTLVVTYSVQRPFAAGRLLNTASVASPDAILSGTLSDAAAIVVQPRLDVAATTKTITPATPRIGQVVQFTVTAQNLGPDDVTSGADFKIVDDLNTSTAGAAVAFGDIVASGPGMSCAVTGTALPDEAALPAGQVRVRCTSNAPVERYATRTISIAARVLKPAALPPAGTVYAGQSNTARVDVPDSLCEFKTETASNGSVSAACNDAASTSNNTRSVAFDVLVPQIDLQQRKVRVLPTGQTAFAMGQPLRYRFRLQNNGPSRAEGVTMDDLLTVPAGFTLASPQVFNVNGVPAEGGYTLDASKNASVSCSQAAANANVICTLGATPAASYLDAGAEVNFEVELQQSGSAPAAVSYGNQAMVCGSESAQYETAGACNRGVANNNNLAAVNDVIFPRVDLQLSKTRVTPGTVGINQPVEYLLQAQNLGPSGLQQMRFTDTLPAGFELIASGPLAPSVALGSGVTQAPSTVTGADLSCTAVPATVTAPSQQQVVSCVVDARPGPLGAGVFPAGPDFRNTVTVRLFARAKDGVFNGPYDTALVNRATVAPGLDGSNNPLAIDPVPANNTSTAAVPVGRASLTGRVFIDRDGNGRQDGTTPAADEGIGNVTVTLSGADLWGNPVSRTVTTVNTIGATRGDYRFDDLPPGRYSVTETQPATLSNSVGTPVPASAGGSYLAAAGPAISRWSGIDLPVGTAATGYDFPEAAQGPGISGRVYVDRQDNGGPDPGDAGIPGVTLGLYPAGTVCPANGALPGGALQTVTTDAIGAYAFSVGVAGQSYEICQQQPPAHADRPPQPGNAASTPRANQISITALPAGGSANNHFPEVLGRISGLVFHDFNPGQPGNVDNGNPDAGEPGIGSATPGAGVPVTLTGTPSAGPGAGVPIAPVTVFTDADGAWRFDDLYPGTYSVTEGAIPLALGTYVDGRNTAGPVVGGTAGTAGAVGDNAIRNIGLTNPGAVSTDNRFAELPRAAIWGLVFIDENADNRFTSADRGRLRDVEIELRTGGTNCQDGTLLGSTRSAADGSFLFPGGTVTGGMMNVGQPYRLCEKQPEGWVNGPTLAGTNGTPFPDRIEILSLPVTGSGLHYFGERPVVLGTIPPYITGTVFVDRNRDGVLDNSDPGRIPGVVLRLVEGDSCSGRELGRTTTDPQGRYQFPPVGGTAPMPVVGNRYSVCEEQPSDYADGRTVPGGGNASPEPNHIVIPALSSNGSTNNDFGEWGARLDGRVYLDRDGNGRLDGADNGIGGVTVTLTRGGDGSTRTVTTGADGRFAFEDLPAGNWTLTEQAAQPVASLDGAPVTTRDGTTTPGSAGGSATPSGTTPSAISGITLPPGGASTGNLFGEVPTAGISGRVWMDSDGDGRVGSGEAGIPGVTIVLTGTDDRGQPVSRTTTTGPDGRYSFDDLRPGTYTVTEPQQPAGTRNSATNPGSTGGSGTPNGVLPSAISGIVLGVGQRSVDNDFGETTGAPDLRVAKAAVEPRFVVGRTGHYAITVRNAGDGPTDAVLTVSDRLPAGLTLAAVPTGDGWTCSASVGASSFSCSRAAGLAGGATAPLLQAAVNVAAAAVGSSPASNAVLVDGGGEAADRAPTSDERDRFTGNPGSLPLCVLPPAHNACRSATEVVQPAALSGTVWLDGGSRSRELDDGDRRLPGWIVELVDPATGRVIATTTTGPDGRYRFTDLEPGVPLGVRFRDPAGGIVYPGAVNGEAGSPAASCKSQGWPSSCGGGRHDPLLTVVLAPGQELTQQSLPVDPSGTVYDSGSRDPVPGAVVTLAPVGSCPAWDPASQVVAAGLGGYTVSGAAISMTTGSNGFYNFVLQPSAPAHCLFGLTVKPGSNWTAPSQQIPPQPQPLVAGGTPGSVVLVQPQPVPPTGSASTTYYTQIDMGSGTADVLHNHIPVDPAAPAGLRLSKTVDRAVAEVGDTLRYRITVQVAPGASPRQVSVVDRLPAGFTFIAGTAQLDGRRLADPAGVPGPQLVFQLGAVPAGGSVTLQYRVRVGVGAAHGDGVNRATAWGCQTTAGCVTAGSGAPLTSARGSNEGRATVRVAGGAFGIEACVLGKVFVDCNGNHVQDREELGIPGVRLVLQDGTFLTSDSEGKFSMCGLPPKSHVLRVDETTLPRGARLTTSSNRNLGDAGSLWLDLKLGELHRADVIEGSCSATVLDQVKARRAQGEVSVPQVEKAGRPALRFDSKAHGANALSGPAQGTDGSNQQVPKLRPVPAAAAASAASAANDERALPTNVLPMNRPPPRSRRTSDAPDAPASNPAEDRDAR